MAFAKDAAFNAAPNLSSNGLCPSHSTNHNKNKVHSPLSKQPPPPYKQHLGDKMTAPESTDAPERDRERTRSTQQLLQFNVAPARGGLSMGVDARCSP